MRIRNSAKAIILRDNRILTIKKEDKEGYYYILPGGGQEHGESLHETVKRECIEEINADVVVGSLLFIREYIGKNHEHYEFDREVHQIEYMFSCRIVDGSMVGNGIVPDDGQIGVEWLPLRELIDYRLYPQAMREKLIDFTNGIHHPVYLGDIN